MTTTLETLTIEQVHALSANADRAGDTATVADCSLVYQAYLDSDCSELSAAIDETRGAVREAARRIVDTIAYAEGRAEEDQ